MSVNSPINNPYPEKPKGIVAPGSHVADKAVLIDYAENIFFRFAKDVSVRMSSLPRDNKKHTVRSEIISDVHEREIYNQKVFHLSLLARSIYYHYFYG
jgi:hypothetical protein